MTVLPKILAYLENVTLKGNIFNPSLESLSQSMLRFTFINFLVEHFLLGEY